MFRRVRILEGDDPSLHEMLSVTMGAKGQGFPLPCKALQNRSCTIYCRRPQTCADWKCKLLWRFEKEELTFPEAMRIVVQTAEHAARVRAMLEAAVEERGVPLIQIYRKLEESSPLSPENARAFLEFNALRVRVDKHFKTKEIA